MIVAGVMSGTSADGINVALVRIGSAAARRTPMTGLRIKLLGHAEFPYPRMVRRFILSTMNAPQARVADMARLNVLLGELYADAVRKTERRLRLKAHLVGCHGQTIYHQGERSSFLGRTLNATWQTGEGAVIAARLGVPVVSDFRPADMAAGGKGAPLVPFLDFFLYRDARVGRIVQNIGGIANLTAIPAAASAKRIIAFDTGPGNMVIDAVTERLFHRHYDRDGGIAASGTVLEPVVARILAEPFFRQKPPKTAGREQFGRQFADRFIKLCGKVNKRDMVATATALTAMSIADAVRRLVLRRRGSYREFIVSGGGARNATLMAMLANQLQPLGIQVRISDEFGIPSEAKEAVAFAVLAHETWHRRPSNIVAATGAKRPAILGKISYA
jgi:anhydro-N-acetylmuramic acid kinase